MVITQYNIFTLCTNQIINRDGLVIEEQLADPRLEKSGTIQ